MAKRYEIYGTTKEGIEVPLFTDGRTYMTKAIARRTMRKWQDSVEQNLDVRVVEVKEDPVYTDAFAQGYACAIATVVRSHGANAAAEDAISCMGWTTTKKLKAAGIEEYDLSVLLPIAKAIEDRDKRYKRISADKDNEKVSNGNN